MAQAGIPLYIIKFVFVLVIRISLFIQNLLVCLSALVILAILFRKPGHPGVLKVCEAAIIILGAASNLASQASTIAIERDWVVVVAADDKDFLAGLFLICVIYLKSLPLV